MICVVLYQSKAVPPKPRRRWAVLEESRNSLVSFESILLVLLSGTQCVQLDSNQQAVRISAGPPDHRVDAGATLFEGALLLSYASQRSRSAQYWIPTPARQDSNQPP